MAYPLFCLCLFYLLAPMSLFAQEAVSSPEVLSDNIVKRVDEVFLMISATDWRGRFVKDIGRDDVKIFDNHMPPAHWNYFEPHTDLPLRVMLMIDTSGSVAPRFRFEQQAASAFLKRVLRPGIDEAGVILFDEKVHEMQALTGNFDKIAIAFDGLHPGNSTLFYDAVIAGAQKLAENSAEQPMRRVLLVISDGKDNGSHASLRTAEYAALKSEAVILSLDSGSPSTGKSVGSKVLTDLATSSGGLVLPAQEKSELKKAFQKAETFLRNQYAVGYTPMNFKADGGFHRIELKAERRGLKLHARQGYFAPKN